MTTDAFTDAARAEAERYFADPGVDPLTLSVIDHAMHMAVWARDHLAAQEPTEEEVRAAANAIVTLVPGETEETAHMDDIDDAWDHARAALTAAQEARR